MVCSSALTRCMKGRFTGSDQIVDHKLAMVGMGSQERQLDGIAVEFPAGCAGRSQPAESRRNTRLHHMIRVRMPFVPAEEQVGRRIRGGVKDAHEAVPGRVGLPGQLVGAHLVRLEDGPHPVIIGLRNRVQHVVVTLCAPDGDAQERLGGVLECVLHPLLAAEQLVIANEKTRGPQGVRIERRQFIGGQHLENHPVIAFVGIERLDDPIAPAPDVRLAVANLVAVGPAGPVAVTPHIHPVAGPALPVARIVQQPIHDPLVGLWGCVDQKRALFLGRWNEPCQIQIHPAQQYFAARLGSRLESARVLFFRDEGIDGIPAPAGVPGLGHGRPLHGVERVPLV